jgi:alkylhydroperoxidase family enzyme
MTAGTAMSDATFAELREHLSEEHLLDLVLSIAFYNGVVRVLATMQIDVEPEYRKYLEQFPLPPS